MIKPVNLNDIRCNFDSVIDYAKSNYADTNIHTDLLESLDLDSQVILEGIISGEDELLDEAVNVTDAKIIHDGKGTAISVKVNGTEYRYVSATKSTAELYRSFMGMLKYANAGYKALNWLKKNALEYYGSKNPSEEGRKLMGLSESMNEAKYYRYHQLSKKAKDKANEDYFGLAEDDDPAAAEYYYQNCGPEGQGGAFWFTKDGTPIYDEKVYHESVRINTTKSNDLAKETLGLMESTRNNDYTNTTNYYYKKAMKYDIGDLTADDVYQKTPKFNKVAFSISRSLDAGEISCYRYAAVVASIMDKLGIKYKVYQGVADPSKNNTFIKGDPDNITMNNHVWLVCNGKYYETFKNSDSIKRCSNPEIIKLTESTQPNDIPPNDADEEIEEEKINEAISTEVFTKKSTGMSYYDDFLDKKDHDYKRLVKGLQGKIVYMSPKEYLKRLGTDIFKCSYDRVMRGVDMLHAEEITDEMINGKKYDMPVLDLANKTQEGRHRAIAADKLGISKIPVLVVTPWDAHKELKMPECMNLWYGHTIQWIRKNGTQASETVGLDLEKVRKKVQEIIESGDYQK